MMRSFLYITTASAVIALAYWAYTENIKTQVAITHTEQLQVEIGKQRARLAILKAEWAYQNRPERLQDLANLNFDRLQLLPLRADHFGLVEHVSYPLLPSFDLLLIDPVDVAERSVERD